jgi:two-component system response regulator AtoC
MIRLALAIKDRALQRYLDKKFQDTDVRVKSFGHLKAPWQEVIRSCGDIIVISESLIPPPTESGISMLNELPENPTTVVLHESDSSEEHAKLVAEGADVVLYTCISKKSLVEAIESTLESRRQYISKNRLSPRDRMAPNISDFISESRAMQIFIDEVRRIIPGNSPLLLLGETGVGKEHLAKAIHAESPRSSGPLITVNTPALPEQLLESELFGHEQGAFTGAIRSRRGAFELAHGGTIFLDEIGDMPLPLQAKLLRVLQDYEVKPIGSELPIWTDIRVIAATNRDLEAEIEAGNFRKDLYYRLSVVMLTIPPVRQHKEDIPAMARRFLNFYRHKIAKDIDGFTEEAMNKLCGYDWPGNIRELMNVIERAMLLCQSDKITLGDLPHIFHRPSSISNNFLPDDGTVPEDWKGKTLPEVRQETMDKIEVAYLQMVLKEENGRVGKAAKKAGIHIRAMYNKMRRLGLQKEAFK